MKVRKGVSLVLVALLIFSGYYLAISLSQGKKTIVTLKGSYDHLGKLDYAAELKPNLIYGKEKIGTGDTVYSSLLSNMTLLYSYRMGNAKNVSGSYEIEVLEGSFSREKWEKVYFKDSGEFENELNLEIPVNWTEILQLWKGIEKETKYDFGEPTLKVTMKVRVRGDVGEKVESNFNHTAEVVYGRTIKFMNLEKSETKKIVDRKIVEPKINLFSYPLPAEKAKLTFATIFGFSLLGVVISTNAVNADNLRNLRNSRKGGKYVRISKLENFSRVVEVSDVKGLEKLSYELDKPIMSFEDKLVVLDGDTAYVCGFFSK